MTKATMIIDLQYGSTGKGLIAGYLAEKEGYDTVINANMPNAGHTYINSVGRKWMHKVLPNGIVSPNLKCVMIGPGSVFEPSRLQKEIDDSTDLLENVRIMIHPLASVLDPHHREMEAQVLNGISSTMQGSAAAMVEKIWRQKDQNPTAIDNLVGDLRQYLCSIDEWRSALNEAKSILIEGAQGHSLGLNAGFYPYCTSRDCTPARFLADCGVPHKMLGRVVGTARVHPIRVGNTKDGHSGGHYPDQYEMNWDDLGVEAETTTVTGRIRRVFSFSRWQIEAAIFDCQPDDIFLNFCNYDDEDSKFAIEQIKEAGGKIKYLGFGPTIDDVRELK